VTGTSGPAHPRAPPVAAKPSAGCAGRRHTHPLLQQIRRGCGGGFRVRPDGSDHSWPAPAGGALFRRGSDHPARGSGRPRHGPGVARRWLAPEWWGEGGGSDGLSMAALCPLLPRNVAGSLFASPVDAPLPVMGGSLLLALFI
jgi:hypothetical protein